MHEHYAYNLTRHPIMLDAVQFGAYAHRCRNFWQNFSSPREFGTSLAAIHCPLGLQVKDFLSPGRT